MSLISALCQEGALGGQRVHAVAVCYDSTSKTLFSVITIARRNTDEKHNEIRSELKNEFGPIEKTNKGKLRNLRRESDSMPHSSRRITTVCSFF